MSIRAFVLFRVDSDKISLLSLLRVTMSQFLQDHACLHAYTAAHVGQKGCDCCVHFLYLVCFFVMLNLVIDTAKLNYNFFNLKLYLK